MLKLLGVDTGGTFTDFVLLDENGLRVHKVLSTPGAPERAILQGMGELGLGEAGLGEAGLGEAGGRDDLLVVHGSTVATNAVLEGKGVRTAYITNRGLGDVLTLGRQAREDLYRLRAPPKTPPVPKALCVEVASRLAADGESLESLDQAALVALREKIAELAPRAVAINLLFSFLDDAEERAIEAVMPEGVFVSRGSEVMPEYREYERGIATWLNAYVGPLVQGYLERLRGGVAPARLAVMQSSGDTIDAAAAGRHAVRLLLSGPAGGLAGARFLGGRSDCEQLLTFDMGGTSTDVALIDGEIRLSGDGHIAGYPVSVPMVDMHTIGAGGGSIADVDAGGLLQVGPESAGASPGPACYGQGGERATVTDANLVLGRLLPEAFLGGNMRLDVAAARAAVARVAAGLGCGLEQAAEGIVRVANEHMARALRVISVQRGVDPREFTLMCFGGAGGLHVCSLAEALRMPRALVPMHGGVLSALGMLAAPRGRRLARTHTGLIAELPVDELNTVFEELESAGLEELAAEGLARERVEIQRQLDLRYRGQSSTLTVAWRDAGDLGDSGDSGDARNGTAADFHAAHENRFGHRLDLPVEVVNVRVGLRGPLPNPPLAATSRAGQAAAPYSQTVMPGIGEMVAVWKRESLAKGQTIDGPALITETVSTTYLAPGWRARVDGVGNLILRRRSTAGSDPHP